MASGKGANALHCYRRYSSFLKVGVVQLFMYMLLMRILASPYFGTLQQLSRRAMHGQPERGFVEPGGSSAAVPRRREGNFYLPAATASWRLRLLRTADMSDAAIASIR